MLSYGLVGTCFEAREMKTQTYNSIELKCPNFSKALDVVEIEIGVVIILPRL